MDATLSTDYRSIPRNAHDKLEELRGSPNFCQLLVASNRLMRFFKFLASLDLLIV